MKRWYRSFYAGAVLGVGFASVSLAEDETDNPNSSPEMAAAEEALVCIPDVPASGCNTPEPCQPPPPACGPGSLIYSHTANNTLNYVYKDENGPLPGGELQYNLYEPSNPQPASAPLIVFLPGYTGGADPSGGLALFTHLARKGYIVLFVNYGGAWPDFAAYESNANQAIAHALAELQRPGSGHVTPDLTKVAFVGHSLGGMLITRLAANPGPGVPSPKVIVPAEPANDILYPIGTDHLQCASPAAGATIIQCLHWIPLATWACKRVPDTFSRSRKPNAKRRCGQKSSGRSAVSCARVDGRVLLRRPILRLVSGGELIEGEARSASCLSGASSDVTDTLLGAALSKVVPDLRFRLTLAL